MTKKVSIRTATALPEDSIGHFPHDLLTSSGVLDFLTTHWKVTEHNPTGMSVDIAAGRGYFRKTAMTYHGQSDAVDTVSISANSSGNPRIDAVVIYVDLGTSANSNASNILLFTVVAGTASSSPVPPDDTAIQSAVGAGNPFIRLAEIQVDNGATAITNAKITDKRPQAGFRLPAPYLRYYNGKIQFSHDGVLYQDMSSGDGWTPYTAVIPTRQSTDDPTYVLRFAGVDLTSMLYVGMKVKWTQDGTERFGIITAKNYATSNTDITIYTGTDYDVDDTISHPISNFSYSVARAPAGFPTDRRKWTVRVVNTLDVQQLSPTQNQWYNLGSISIDIPIGIWNVRYQVNTSFNRASNGDIDQYVTLSTANNSQSDAELTARSYLNNATGGSGHLSREKPIALTSKTTHYLNSKNASGSSTQINFLGAAVGPTIVEAVCDYL